MAGSSYQFPLIPLEEVVCVLKSMDIRVEEVDFKTPDVSVITGINSG